MSFQCETNFPSRNLLTRLFVSFTVNVCMVQEWFFDHCHEGGGDPRRTPSGNVNATFTLDPSIHFHGNEDKNEILNWVRYRCNPATQKYRQELSMGMIVACMI